jgi:hypothetical protein
MEGISMNITVVFTDPGCVTITNTSTEDIEIQLGWGNGPILNGISIVPPNGTYLGIDITKSQGGAYVKGSNGPLWMPKGSSAVFNISA